MLALPRHRSVTAPRRPQVERSVSWGSIRRGVRSSCASSAMAPGEQLPEGGLEEGIAAPLAELGTEPAPLTKPRRPRSRRSVPVHPTPGTVRRFRAQSQETPQRYAGARSHAPPHR